jgi:hypothetical protein
MWPEVGSRVQRWFRERLDPRIHGRLGVSRTPFRAQCRSVSYRGDFARRRLLNDRDAWLATRGDVTDGVYIVPLSFLADSSGIWFATKPHRRIAADVTAIRRVEVIFGGYLDAVIIDGTCDEPTAQPATDIHARYEAKAGFAPSPDHGYVLIRLGPQRLRVSRSPAEFADRDVWTADTQPWAIF